MNSNTALSGEKVKNCPFCGGDEVSHGYTYPPEEGSVQCHDCDAFVVADSEAEAIVKWNARALTSETRREGEEPVAYLTVRGNDKRVVLAKFITDAEAKDGSNGWTAIPLYVRSASSVSVRPSQSEDTHVSECAAGQSDGEAGTPKPNLSDPKLIEGGSPEDEAERFIQAAVDRAPEPLRRLGVYLSNILDGDHWATAERMLLGAATASLPPAEGNVGELIEPAIYVNSDLLEELDARGMVVYPRPTGTYRIPLYSAQALSSLQAKVATLESELADAENGIITLKSALEASQAQVASLRGSQAVIDVLTERSRQVEAEGWTPEHDDKHDTGEMAVAAACYALSSAGYAKPAIWEIWPKAWGVNWFKPKDRRRDLVKSVALGIAEIERLDRSALSTKEGE
jgi:Lar family restriction alleviation protein